MSTFHYSLHTLLDSKDRDRGFRNIGVMVWSETTLDYFAVGGNEVVAHEMTKKIAHLSHQGRSIREFVDHFQETHGGLHSSIARPGEVAAESPQDAALRIGKSLHLDIVVPVPPGTGLDREVIRELLAATESGAELEIRGATFNATDLALFLGFGALPPAYVFAYLPFPYDFSPFSRGRFHVDSIERIPGGWRLQARDAWKWELGPLTVEIRPTSDPAIQTAMASFKDDLDDDQAELIEERLQALIDPRMV